MKKFFAIAILATVVSVSANAQFGIKAGANLSTLHGDDVSGVDSKFGFHGGFYYNAAIGESFSVAPDVVFSTEGAKSSGGEGSYHLDYVNIAALARYNTMGGFYIGTGPQLGLLVSAKAKGGGMSEDVKDIFTSTNFSWALAAGYRSTMGLGGFARYNFGISNIAEEDGVDAKLSTFQVGLTYDLTKLVKGKK